MKEYKTYDYSYRGIGDCPECFGDLREEAPKCQACVFAASCRIYRDDPPRDPYAKSTKEHYISIDQYGYSEDLATDFAEILTAEEEQERKRKEGDREMKMRDLYDLLHFLLYVIDDYTCAILLEMLRNGHRDTATLAKAFGVSREAIHRKIMDMAELYPQLRPMLELTMRRCALLSSREGRSGIKQRNKRRRENKGKTGARQPDLPLL